VADLIAAGNAWVYATSAQEQDLFHSVATGVDILEQVELLKELRAVLYSAQLDFGRALAVVRLTCLKEVVDAAENLRIAVMDFEQESRDKGQIAIETGSTPEATDPERTVPRRRVSSTPREKRRNLSPQRAAGSQPEATA